MAKRKFELPGIQSLNKSQEDARALPKDGQHLIIGGPGTGKSVLSLLRARRHHQDKEDYVFLVYNHLLNQASGQLFGTNLQSYQWQSWFEKTFWELTNNRVPKLPEKQGTSWRPFDWEKVLSVIAALPVSEVPQKFPYLIIDEGQDMPPEFYWALVNLGFVNFFVAADQNQQIVSGENSTREEISNALGVEPYEVVELRLNYRNTYPIAKLARAFYTGDPASPPPELPAPVQTARKPQLIAYQDGQFKSLIANILKISDNNTRQLIGVICPDNDVRRRYFRSLVDCDVVLDNGTADVRTYSYGDNPSTLRFNEGGVMVINAQSCKGLEFDMVILADIDKHKYWPEIADQKKRLFYVMVARAIVNIIMFKRCDGENKYCPVDPILPQDTDVLERR